PAGTLATEYPLASGANRQRRDVNRIREGPASNSPPGECRLDLGGPADDNLGANDPSTSKRRACRRPDLQQARRTTPDYEAAGGLGSSPRPRWSRAVSPWPRSRPRTPPPALIPQRTCTRSAPHS